MSSLNKFYLWIAGLAAVLFGLFEWEQNKNKSLETKLTEVKFKNENQPLDAKIAQDDKLATQQEQTIKTSVEPTTVPDLTPEEAIQYWKGKK